MKKCPVCDEALIGRRSDARFHSDSCKAEASRLVRILQGEPVQGYSSLADRLAAGHRRTWGLLNQLELLSLKGLPTDLQADLRRFIRHEAANGHSTLERWLREWNRRARHGPSEGEPT